MSATSAGSEPSSDHRNRNLSELVRNLHLKKKFRISSDKFRSSDSKEVISIGTSELASGSDVPKVPMFRIARCKVVIYIGTSELQLGSDVRTNMVLNTRLKKK